MDGEAKALTAEEATLAAFWATHTDEQVARWADGIRSTPAEDRALMFAEDPSVMDVLIEDARRTRARADAADKRAEAIRAKLVEICEDASEGDMEWLSLLKEKSERVSRLEAEAGALRAAVEYVASALRLVIASKPCTFVTEALAASNSALAPGAGERVAEAIKAAKEERAIERAAYGDELDYDDSDLGEWVRRGGPQARINRRAALDALDGGMR